MGKRGITIISNMAMLLAEFGGYENKEQFFQFLELEVGMTKEEIAELKEFSPNLTGAINVM